MLDLTSIGAIVVCGVALWLSMSRSALLYFSNRREWDFPLLFNCVYMLVVFLQVGDRSIHGYKTNVPGYKTNVCIGYGLNVGVVFILSLVLYYEIIQRVINDRRLKMLCCAISVALLAKVVPNRFVVFRQYIFALVV